MGTITDVIERIKRHNLRIAFLHDLSFNEPVGIGYLSAYLKKYFPSVRIELFDPKVDILSAVESFRPDLVLYSIMTGQHNESIERNKRLKRILPSFISVFGGPHATYFPEMIHNEGVDIVCQGEGEGSLKNLVGRILCRLDIRDIKGFWIKDNGKIYKNDVNFLIEDLDAIPFPDRDLYYNKSSFLRSYGIKPIVGARGCPFKCSYCYNSGLNTLFRGKGKILRYRSPESVVKEIAEVKSRYNVKFITFIEDVFSGVNIEWLKEFHERYLKLRIPFFISIRAEFVKPEIAKCLKKSGCISVSMAIEHGDFTYRKKYLFRNMTDEAIIEGTRILESEGIRVAPSVMLGLPFTNIKDDLKSLELICKSGPTHATTFIFQPYPGTALTNLCQKHGLIDNIDINKLKNSYSKAYLKGIDYEKVLKLHNSFSVIWLLKRWFNIDIEYCFEKLPNWEFFKWLNIAIKYFTFKKIMYYRRSLLEAIKEICSALITGAFGIRFNKKKVLW